MYPVEHNHGQHLNSKQCFITKLHLIYDLSLEKKINKKQKAWHNTRSSDYEINIKQQLKSTAFFLCLHIYIFPLHQ